MIGTKCQTGCSPLLLTTMFVFCSVCICIKSCEFSRHREITLKKISSMGRWRFGKNTGLETCVGKKNKILTQVLEAMLLLPSSIDLKWRQMKYTFECNKTLVAKDCWIKRSEMTHIMSPRDSIELLWKNTERAYVIGGCIWWFWLDVFHIQLPEYTEAFSNKILTEKVNVSHIMLSWDSRAHMIWFNF